MRTRSTRVTILLLGACAVLAGCASEPATVTDTDAILRLKLDEYTIRPQNLRVVATSDPMPIKIVARNLGRLTHNVTVERMDEDANTPDTGATDGVAVDTRLGFTPTAQPGQTVRTPYGEPILLKPGTYRLSDGIGNHDNLGQNGTLTITKVRAGG